MRTGLAIPATLSSIRPLSLNRVDTVQNDYTKLLGQIPELTRPTTKGEPVSARPRRLAPDKLVTAKREFNDMIKTGLNIPCEAHYTLNLSARTAYKHFQHNKTCREHIEYKVV